MKLFASRRKFALLCIAVGLLVFGVSYTLLGLPPQNVVCAYCAPGCTQTYDSAEWEDIHCSCPTYETCVDVQTCDDCYYNGVIVCYDQANDCGGSYIGTFTTAFGCCAC